MAVLRGDIELAGLTKSYDGVTTVVQGINLRIPDGAYCCFLGPSGCGKTTILRMIAGHEDPTGGEILIGGENVVGLPPVARAEPRGSVERGKRFVEQQQGRLGGESARQRHALLLAAGNRARQAAGQIGQSEGFQVFPALAGPRGERNVPRDGEVRKERVVLKQKTGAPFLRRQAKGARVVEPWLAAEGDGAFAGAVEARQHPQQRSLAGAGRAEQHRDRRLIERNAQLRVEREAGIEARPARAVQFAGHIAQTRRCSA